MDPNLLQYATYAPQRVISGIGAVDELAAQVEKLGKKRAFILTGNSMATKTDLVAKVEGLLGGRHAGTYAGCGQHVPEPCVEEATGLAREAKADCLIAVGGGSPVDAAKNVALNLLGDRPREAMPQIAIPTTLSAGEFTAAAGRTNVETRVKKGRRDPRMLPAVVLLDPEMTVPTPSWLWASTAIKALDHAVEALWSPRAHPVTDTLAVEAISRLGQNLHDSLDPENLEARLACQLAAWLSIFGAANVGMRLSHPLGHQIGARWDVPHGVTSCIVLPAVMRFFEPSTAAQQQCIAGALGTGPWAAGLADGASAADRVGKFIGSLDVPTRLSETGAVEDELPDVAAAVAFELRGAKSPDAETATEEVLLSILRQVW